MFEFYCICIFSFLVTLEPPLHEMPVVMTNYRPAEGGINCDVDCSRTALNYQWSPADFGSLAACIPEWLGRSLRTRFGTFWCGDTGGLIRPFYSEHYHRWVIPIDVLWDESLGVFPYNYYLTTWRFDP
jgi:hypothetical protein